MLQSSHDTDGGTSMARHLTKVADSGAQDSNKFPSNIYNHKDNLKLTDKDTEIAAEHTGDRSETPADEETHIPLNEYYDYGRRSRALVTSLFQDIGIVANYKRFWGIPSQCKLVGGGENTLNSNNAGPISNTANQNSPSAGATGANNRGDWPAGHNPSSTGAVTAAWNSGGNGNNSGNRQQVGANPSANNASHPSNTSQNAGK